MNESVKENIQGARILLNAVDGDISVKRLLTPSDVGSAVPEPTSELICQASGLATNYLKLILSDREMFRREKMIFEARADYQGTVPQRAVYVHFSPRTTKWVFERAQELGIPMAAVVASVLNNMVSEDDDNLTTNPEEYA